MNIIVAIVNYNSWKETKKMLDSATVLNIIPTFWIIDNCSTCIDKKIIDYIIHQYNFANLISLPKNYGYLGAIAQFLIKKPDIKFDWLFVANADLLFTDKYLFNHLENFRRNKKIGIYCPSIISKLTQKDQNPFLRKQPSYWYYVKYRILCSSIFIYSLYNHLYNIKSILNRFRKSHHKNERKIMDIFAPHGSFFGISRNFFDTGGYIEIRNFLYHEEEIMGFICKSIGMNVIYDQHVSIIHEEHAVTGRGITKKKLQLKRQSLSILREYIINTM